jgi:hypothetical protein
MVISTSLNVPYSQSYREYIIHIHLLYFLHQAQAENYIQPPRTFLTPQMLPANDRIHFWKWLLPLLASLQGAQEVDHLSFLSTIFELESEDNPRQTTHDGSLRTGSVLTSD